VIGEESCGFWTYENKRRGENHFTIVNYKILILLVYTSYAGMKFLFWVKVIQQSFSIIQTNLMEEEADNFGNY